MPPEYLSRAEADQRFRELEASMGKMAVDLGRQEERVGTVEEAITELKKMIADKSQQRLVIAMFVVTNLVTIGLAVFGASK